MLSFSRMKFSRKIFLALFGMAAGTALVISFALYTTLAKGRYQEFADSYIDHMKLFTKTLAGIEDAEAQIARNAAEMVRLQGPLKDHERLELAKYLGVDEINIYSSRKELLALFPTLPEYAGGPSTVYQTPMIRGTDGRVGQHSLIASKDGKRIIEIMMDFDDITQLLRDMTYHDEDNLAVELVNPENQSLGRIQREGFVEQTPLTQVLAWPDGAHYLHDRLHVLTSIEHATKPKNRLVATISTRALESELKRIQQILLGVCLVLLLLSWALAKVLTKVLLQKIENIRVTLAEITQKQDYSQRVPTTGNLEAATNEIEQLGLNLNRMLETMQAHQERLLDAARDKTKTQVAAQVAHDIRSPLMSLNMALGQLHEVALEPLALIRSAATRIAGIVQKLSETTRPQSEATPVSETPKLTLIEPLIATVVNEHRVRQKPGQTLKVSGLPSVPATWSVVQVSELQTALSNILNNAFEAGATTVELSFSCDAGNWTLSVADNGSGIPAAIQSKIFERSFTHGKTQGTGLGLFQAKAAIEWSGGSLTITSSSAQGTTFEIKVPLEKKPAWLPTHLELAPHQPVIFVDDDHLILNTWKQKAEACRLTQAHFFDSAEALQDFLTPPPFTAEFILVIDQNLGGKTGLQVLKELSLGRRGYLCTTDFDEAVIQNEVKKLNAYLIPKIWVAVFEIKVRNT